MKKENQKDEVLMKYLGKLYQKYENEEGENRRIEEGNGEYYQHEFLIDIERIIDRLPSLYAEIIRNDFLCVKGANWWKNKYDEKTHEQLKNIAVKAFFHCLYI